ncbi:hypothetical protein CY35_12G077400 [Sphagnum magellanicum]|nr:hypothetical protein CY35_12G077400 [Sphagnum magellanicum]
MQLRYLTSLLSARNAIVKVTALAWSPSRRLAAVTLDRIVYLFDENGELKDKFFTKSADPKGSKMYIATDMVFSPDSTKLAIAQSDEIIFVYNLGIQWGERKSICNKFQQRLPIVNLIWPSQHQRELLFGLTDGKVKVGQLRTNQATTIYAHGGGSPVCGLACSLDGASCIVSHLDGSIYSVPLALLWGKSIVAIGPNCKITFYDQNGGILQQFDYSSIEHTSQELSSACINPSGDIVVLGCFNHFRVYSLTNQLTLWEDIGDIQIDDLYTISTLAWKPDGSQLAVGGLCGNVDIFDAYLHKELYQGKFEFTYVTKSRVIVKQLLSGTCIVIYSQYGWEILKINIYHNQYLIAYTLETLLMGNLESCKLSEVSWHGSGQEKFLMNNPSICMIHNVGELSLVEYGCNEVLGMCRTKHLSPFLISLRLNDHPLKAPNNSMPKENKKIAYLIDLQTIQILDLSSGVTIGTLNHDYKIDWLELNPIANYLLFRNEIQQLHLFNVITKECTTLLSFCTYVQWVPHSDVVVAQNQRSLFVWYNIKMPELATIFPLKGNIEGIERVEGRTEVIVDEGGNVVSYVLDEALIEFGSALETFDYDHAIAILEPLQLTPEIEAMWKQLAEMALQHKELFVAERCYVVLGDVAKIRFLQKVSKMKMIVTQEQGVDGLDQPLIQSKLALLQHEWKIAKKLLLNTEHDQVDHTIQMYIECHRWQEAIVVASSQNHPDVESLQKRHYEWLLQTGQEREAGRIKNAEGDVLGAITLFLKGGLPGLAADCAGVFLERLGKYDKAKEAYQHGHAYNRGIELARRHFPNEVVVLEEEWGDWLISQNQVDTAINHFIEANCIAKAIEYAIASRRWTKATQIIEAQDAKVALPIFKRLALYFEATKQYIEAENFFIRANLASEAVEMYIHVNKWEAAHKVATCFLSELEVRTIYLRQAKDLDTHGSYKDAEKLYIKAQEHDLAIDMYRKARLFNHMIRLIANHRQDLLFETHIHLAQQLESEGSLWDAEQHYLVVQDWKNVVKMYSANGLWEDAMRVAKMFGGINGSKEVAYAWAVSLGEEAGTQLLVKLGFVEQAIEYAMEAGAFEHAFDLSHVFLQNKLPEVELKYAMFLEDEGRFKDAEDAFIKVGKTREAIDMYIHQHDWVAALRVAELCDPGVMYDVQVAQAQFLMKKNEPTKAETLFINEKMPNPGMMMYEEKQQRNDAIRIVENFLPSKALNVRCDHETSFMQSQNGGHDTVESLMARGQTLEHNQNYTEAIDLYLQLDSSLILKIDKLQQVWGMAVNLAKDFVLDRLSEVINTVAKRLTNAGLFEDAAKLYEDINALKEAAKLYMQAGQWDKARQISANFGPPFQQYVDGLYVEHLVEKGEVHELVNMGNINEALELYLRQDNWQKVHELAILLGPDIQKEFSFRHAKQCLKEYKYLDAIVVIAQHGIPLNEPAWELCFFATSQLLNSIDGLVELKKLLAIVHFTLLRSVSTHQREGFAQGLCEITTKISISLLRYIGTIPADKAFHEAAMACKQLGWQDMAFVFLNCFLDIDEAIDDQDGKTSFNSDIISCSDIPHDFQLPRRHCIEEDAREKLRDWVIQLSMDQQVEYVLPMRSCESCGTTIYAASLICMSCKLILEGPIISNFG